MWASCERERVSPVACRSDNMRVFRMLRASSVGILERMGKSSLFVDENEITFERRCRRLAVMAGCEEENMRGEMKGIHDLTRDVADAFTDSL